MLLLITGLAGCGGGEKPAASDSTQNPSIAYKESEISLKKLQSVNGLAMDAMERLVLFDQAGEDSKFVILDKQGREIKQIPCPKEAKKNDYVDGSVFTLDKNNRLYQLQQITVNDNASGDQPREMIKQLKIFSPDGELEKSIELARMSLSNNMNIDDTAASMAADAKGRLYIMNYAGKIEIIDQDGKSLKTITGARYQNMGLNKRGNLLVTGRAGEGFYLAELKADGSTIWKHNLKEIKKRVYHFAYNPYDDCGYIADDSGIKKYDAQGKFRGEVLNYRSTSIFISDSCINNIVFDKAGNIYINIMYNGSESTSGQQFSLFKYTPGKAVARPRHQKVMTVGTADADALSLEKAARLFEKKHPDIRVEIKDYAPDQMRHRDEARYESYVKTMNTEILSGKGPDIISIQGLPYNKYIDKKVFVDLKELMKKDKSFKRQDYYSNILKACETEGKLYGMPVTFIAPVMIADGAMLEKAGVSINDTRWTWSDFHAAAQKMSVDTNQDGNLETYALPAFDNTEMLDYMLASDYRSFVDEDKKQAHFNSDRFIKFLNIYKDLTSTYMNSRVARETLVFSGNRSSIAFMPSYYFGGDLCIAKAEMGAQAKALSMPKGYPSGDKSFDAAMLGINRNSKLQKEAWEFLKYLTGKEQQKSLQLYGFRINPAVQDQMFKEMSERDPGFFTIGSDQGTKTIQQEPMTPAQIAKMQKWMASLNHYNNMDPQIKKLIHTEAAAYLKGEKSATQTAQVLQNKVTLYLNE